MCHRCHVTLNFLASGIRYSIYNINITNLYNFSLDLILFIVIDYLVLIVKSEYPIS
jgi:hypothetical protein